MPRYFLSPGVFMCTTAEGVIFLDLKRDKYLGVPHEQFDSVRPEIDREGRHLEHQSYDSADPSAARRLIDELVHHGLLTTDRPIAYLSEESIQPSESVDDREYSLRLWFSLRSVPTFVLAVLSAAAQIRFLTLERIVCRERIRLERSRKRMPPGKSSEATKLAQAFMTLTPLIFRSRDRCLFESLALMKFLYYNGVGARWVFGVRTAPFGSHCWVQYDHIVLNATLEHAKEFTTIMTV